MSTKSCAAEPVDRRWLQTRPARVGWQLILSDSGSIPSKRVVYRQNRIMEPAWCLPSDSLEDGALCTTLTHAPARRSLAQSYKAAALMLPA